MKFVQSQPKELAMMRKKKKKKEQSYNFKCGKLIRKRSKIDTSNKLKKTPKKKFRKPKL